MKKLINDPLKVTDEMIDGFVGAFPNLVRKLDEVNVVVRQDAPVQGKVGIVSGGGSGHEPLWLGYTGKGMADAIAVGQVFSAPGPKAVYRSHKGRERRGGHPVRRRELLW